MKKIIRKGIIILGVYVLFMTYLLVASERIERLENNNKTEKTSVAINIFE